MPSHCENTYQIKVNLTGAKPPIWRRILVPGDISLAWLHEVIQIAMGWTDSHLHLFEKDGELYGTRDVVFAAEPVRDARRTRLNQLLRREGESLRYEYDFGDGWDHRVKLEKILPFDANRELPVCVKAQGACPPEDIGGLWGYYAAVRGWRDPGHPDHAQYREMFGPDGLDPDAFDVEEVNELLKTYFGKAA